MSLPLRALIVPGGLAFAGYLWWWYTSRKSSPETKDIAASAVELPELTEKDEQCARSIPTRAPVSDKQLQEPLTTQDEPKENGQSAQPMIQEIVDISQETQSCEEIEQLQDPLTSQDKPKGEDGESAQPVIQEIVDISEPAQSCEEIEQLQDPLTSQDDPKGEDGESAQPVIQDIVDIGQPAQSCEEKKMTSPMGQWAKPLDLSTLMSEKPFVRRPQMCQPPKKSSNQLVWEARVPQSLVGKFIGQKGWHVKSLMEESGAKIDIVKPKSSEELESIVVAGTEEQIGTAAPMIIEWFKKLEIDLPFYPPRTELPCRRKGLQKIKITRSSL